MEELIENIVSVANDYRSDAFQFTTDHVRNWVNQFPEQDRLFLLQELNHILPDSYISKENALNTLDTLFETLVEKYNYQDVNQLLEHTCFLDCQDEHKSQTVLLQFLDELLVEKYGRTVNDCGNNEIRFWIYLDDVLASGGTFKSDIIDVVNDFGAEDFYNSPIKIVAVFFIIHTWGKNNSLFGLQRTIGFDIKNKIDFLRVKNIDNNPRLHSYHNPNPNFNLAWPKECEEGRTFLDFIENAFERNYEMRQSQFAFRHEGHPINENFFSSPANRNRYESIILNKGIQIINQIDNLNAQSLRPMGMTPPSYKTLGTGTHCFTWRNISNTCPIVYWWEANGWTPLFPVQNRG